MNELKGNRTEKTREIKNETKRKSKNTNATHEHNDRKYNKKHV